MFAAQASACTGVLKHLLEIAASGSYSWKQAEDHGGEGGDENSPAQRLSVDTQSAKERQSQRSLVREPRDQHDGQSEPEGRARAGENQALHEQLAHDASPARPASATD